MSANRSQAFPEGEGPRRGPRPGCSLILLLLVLLAVAYGSREKILTACARFLIVPGAPGPADVAVALGGGRGERELEAARLYREGMVRRVVLTGGAMPPRGVDLSWPEIMARHLNGAVPDSLLTLELRSRSTYQDALFVLEDLRAMGATSAIVVTDPYHLRRARATFRHVFAGSGVAVSFVPPPRPWFQPERWWQREDAFVAVTEEYIKMAHYAYRYRIWPWN